MVKVAVSAAPQLVTGSLSGCIRRRGAALSTREERPVTADPTKEGRPPLSHAPPKSPFSLPLRLTIQAHADFNEELPKSAAVAALYPGGVLGGPDGCTVAPPSNAFFGVYDGHGGSAAATAAQSRLHVLLGSDPQLYRDTPRLSLEGAFASLEAELRASYAKAKADAKANAKDGDGEASPSKEADKSGTCALAVLLRGQSGRLGEAIAGPHGLLRLRSKAWGCPLPS